MFALVPLVTILTAGCTSLQRPLPEMNKAPTRSAETRAYHAPTREWDVKYWGEFTRVQ